MVRPPPEAKDSRATVSSVCEHMMYEERDPLRVEIPGGTEDSTQSVFEQYDEQTIMVRGSRFKEAPTYRIKLEGSAFVGYRCAIVGGTRSREMIQQIDEILDNARRMIRFNYPDVPEEDYQVHFRVYGKNGIMGRLEPKKDFPCHELVIITEVVANEQDVADAIGHYAHCTFLHHTGYPGSRSDGCGNIAFAFSPHEIGRAPAYEWSIHHWLELEDPCELFPYTIEQVG